MKTNVIYIPGLGDHYDSFRRFALRFWKLYGVTTVPITITWYDKGSLIDKMALVQDAIDTVPADSRIVLLGESAGAALALHVAQSTPRVNRVITLCGVASRNNPIASSMRKKVPALDEAVRSLPSRPIDDIHSFRAWRDGVVHSRYSTAEGATQHVLPVIGHLATIAGALTVLAPYIAAIAKNIKT